MDDTYTLENTATEFLPFLFLQESYQRVMKFVHVEDVVEAKRDAHDHASQNVRIVEGVEGN
jgi:hypothetical protein